MPPVPAPAVRGHLVGDGPVVLAQPTEATQREDAAVVLGGEDRSGAQLLAGGGMGWHPASMDRPRSTTRELSTGRGGRHPMCVGIGAIEPGPTHTRQGAVVSGGRR